MVATSMEKQSPIIGISGALWAVIGVSLLLGTAIYRLAFRALEALEMELGVVHWIALIGFAVFMAHAEGYRGFQKSFSPRTASRAHHLSKSSSFLHALLAPAFAMGFYHANRRTKIVAWALLIGITILVILVKMLPQPWRGIVDAGVVVGLSWGLVSFLVCVGRAFARGEPNASPDLPDRG